MIFRNGCKFVYYSACIITVNNVGGKFRRNKCVIYNIYNILSVPISSDHGTEFIIVGDDPVTLPPQLAFFINLQRAVIGPSATLTGR